MTEGQTDAEVITTVDALGRAIRAHRKRRHLTLESVSGLSNLSMRFLSEMERGKKTAEVGKIFDALQVLGLEVVVRPRHAKVFSNKPFNGATDAGKQES